MNRFMGSQLDACTDIVHRQCAHTMWHRANRWLMNAMFYGVRGMDTFVLSLMFCIIKVILLIVQILKVHVE